MILQSAPGRMTLGISDRKVLIFDSLGTEWQ